MRRHLYYYTLVPGRFDDVAAVLSADPGAWLPAPGAARDEGWEVELRADGALPLSVDRLAAVVSVGPAAVHRDRLLRAVTWRAAVAAPAFPKLEADLELDALGGGASHLSLTGTYRPPLSVVGGAGDALIGRRVAEACVRRFVLDVADALALVAERA